MSYLHAAQVLRLLFSCLRNAPASDTWDLSSLLVNGSPVSQATVVAVLEVLYSNMGMFEAERCETQSRTGQHSLDQLVVMLLFADAVGCSKQVLRQLASLIGRSWLEATLTDSNAGAGNSIAAAAANAAAGSASAVGTVVKLQLHSLYSFERIGDSRMNLIRSNGANCTFECSLTVAQVPQLEQQLSQQLEALLFVGFKLDLQQLLQPALRFLRANSPFLLKAVIDDDIASIFSQRVLAAAGGGSSVALMSRSCIQQPLGLGFGAGDIFGSIVYDKAEADEEMRKVCFNGTLLRDLYEYSKGTRLHVTLDSDGDMVLLDVAENTGTMFTFWTVAGPANTFDAIA
jgi:hypothetical protein